MMHVLKYQIWRPPFPCQGVLHLPRGLMMHTSTNKSKLLLKWFLMNVILMIRNKNETYHPDTIHVNLPHWWTLWAEWSWVKVSHRWYEVQSELTMKWNEFSEDPPASLFVLMTLLSSTWAERPGGGGTPKEFCWLNKISWFVFSTPLRRTKRAVVNRITNVNANNVSRIWPTPIRIFLFEDLSLIPRLSAIFMGSWAAIYCVAGARSNDVCECKAGGDLLADRWSRLEWRRSWRLDLDTRTRSFWLHVWLRVIFIWRACPAK